MSKPAKKRALPKSPNLFQTVIQNRDVKRVRELLAAGHKPDGSAARQAVDACIKASSTAQMKEKPLFGRMPSKKEQEKAAAEAEACYEIAKLLLEGGATVPELLCSAARCGNAKLALLLIRHGADVDYDPPMGTPLENAVTAGNTEIVQALIKAGADIQHQGIGGTLLTRAVDADHSEIARQLIAAGVDVNASPRFGSCALLTAVTKRKAEFVQLLLVAGANVNQKGSIVCGEFGEPEVTEDGMHIPNPPVAREATPLIVAVRRGYADIAGQLIAANADVHALDAEGYTAMVYALKANDQPLIKLLTDAGAKPPKYAEGSLPSAWMAAAKAGDCARLRDLISDGVDVNLKHASRDEDDKGDDDDSDGEATALKYAAQKGHLDAVKLLLASGANVDEKFGGSFDPGQKTALMYAAKAGHLEIAQTLIAAGAAPTARDQRGKTLLHYAAEGGHAGMIDLLMKHSLKVETKTKDGTSPLMAAAATGHADAITALVKAGADPNRFTGGMTALWYAASGGHTTAVQALLNAGADPKAGDKAFSPLQAASMDGHKDVVNLLLKHGKTGKKGGDAKKTTETDGAALADAALMGQVDIVRTLLESGADPDVPGEEHFTALMGAVRAGRIELVQMLLKAGADVNALNEDGETALDLAYDNIKAAKDQSKFLKMIGGDDMDAETREAIHVIKAAGNEDEITEALKKAGGKRAKELKGKRAPRPTEPERKHKEPVEVAIPDFRKRAKKPEYQKAIEDLATITGKRAKPVTNEERNSLNGCVSFQVLTETADKILKEHHEKFLKRGCYLFKSNRGYTSGKDTLTLLPTTNRAEVLAAFQTNGANCDIYTSDIIRWLDELEKTQPFVMTGAGFDWCEGRFAKPVVDSKKLAKQMYEFCPDIVDQGTGDVSRLALELKKTQRFFFWWD
ncbi:MAG TPA: ankyrin repeat domain-containing protein [Verrucomicrobiae bacterium]|nr:ankyrin repeat domain-containing protein [Verrucomicrobiae bacterium]